MLQVLEHGPDLGVAVVVLHLDQVVDFLQVFVLGTRTVSDEQENSFPLRMKA